nr:MAG TPA: hypothetical protein [Caudoviricetes sp.]
MDLIRSGWTMMMSSLLMKIAHLLSRVVLHSIWSR